MEGQSNLKPNRYDIYRKGDDALVVIRTYIEEREVTESVSTDSEEGSEPVTSTVYVWDERELLVPYSDQLQENITANFDLWLKKACEE